MEALTRLVADSLARHGLDRPIDPRRLQWSRWFRCDSPHSLLTVPSKPGIFALAEEVMDLGAANSHVGTAAPVDSANDETRGKSSSDSEPARRMLAVLQFSEDDDMAFTLDRMFTRINPMRERLASGRCFLRFVVIQDQEQRRSICSALNQWMRSSAEKASGIGADFQSSLELSNLSNLGRTSPERESKVLSPDFSSDRGGRTLLSDSPASAANLPQSVPLRATQPVLSSSSHLGSNKNLHCPHPLPSGF